MYGLGVDAFLFWNVWYIAVFSTVMMSSVTSVLWRRTTRGWRYSSVTSRQTFEFQWGWRHVARVVFHSCTCGQNAIQWLWFCSHVVVPGALVFPLLGTAKNDILYEPLAPQGRSGYLVTVTCETHSGLQQAWPTKPTTRDSLNKNDLIFGDLGKIYCCLLIILIQNSWDIDRFFSGFILGPRCVFLNKNF